MKKTFILIATAITMGFVMTSCEKEEDLITSQKTETNSYSVKSKIIVHHDYSEIPSNWKSFNWRVNKMGATNNSSYKIAACGIIEHEVALCEEFKGGHPGYTPPGATGLYYDIQEVVTMKGETDGLTTERHQPSHNVNYSLTPSEILMNANKIIQRATEEAEYRQCEKIWINVYYEYCGGGAAGSIQGFDVVADIMFVNHSLPHEDPNFPIPIIKI